MLKPSVSFDRVEIREYSRCLGNNPATTHGPPLSIDWAYLEVGTFKLEEYEETRPRPRAAYQMIVPGYLRETILLEQTKTTQTQINAMLRELKALRDQRQLCIVMQKLEQQHLIFESLQRKFRRFKTGISTNREMELLWENARTLAEEKKETQSVKVDMSGRTTDTIFGSERSKTN
jgi:hypothetical protein